MDIIDIDWCLWSPICDLSGYRYYISHKIVRLLKLESALCHGVLRCLIFASSMHVASGPCNVILHSILNALQRVGHFLCLNPPYNLPLKTETPCTTIWIMWIAKNHKAYKSEPWNKHKLHYLLWNSIIDYRKVAWIHTTT